MTKSDLIRSKRREFDHLGDSSPLPRKKSRPLLANTATIDIQPLGPPLVSGTTGSSSELIRLEPYQPHTIGRSPRRCDSVFQDRRVSRRHCRILFDAVDRKIRIADGVYGFDSTSFSRARVSMNGVFVNGIRIARGEFVELSAGDEVSLVCGNEGVCSLGVRIGFVVQRIVFVEEAFGENVSNSGFAASGMYPGRAIAGSRTRRAMARVNLLLRQCRHIRHSNSPFSCIQKFTISRGVNGISGFMLNDDVKLTVAGKLALKEVAQVEPVPSKDSHSEKSVEDVNANRASLNSILHLRDMAVVSDVNPAPECFNANANHVQGMEHIAAPRENCNTKELLYPVESLLQIFIATFTSDILWFLSYCEIPARLPVTIACHNSERCWSLCPDKRTSVPFSDFPNLVAVYPPFPEVIAFGKDRKKLGIACHHPKLLVLQREDSIRVIITSANLVEKQWNSVTNTIWWQDFPRTSRPEYFSLFSKFSHEDINLDSKSDFAAQLAGFMASLLVDVPSQAHWILELTKYDFKGAVGHLVASIPGIHSPRAPPILESMHCLPGKQHGLLSSSEKVLGSVETSVVGLSHLFHTSADSNGAQLKKLASFLGKCRENVHGMLEIVLRRNTNIPADANAISILVPNPEGISEGDCIQLGFLPRNVAKWVAPLSDSGLFRFSGYVYPKEVLATASEGNISKVQMILYVSQGSVFSDMSEVLPSVQVSAICSLVASIQRYTGLWRLQEVLRGYKWPEHMETDFIFASSSIGSINARFLAAFSAAAGKTSVQFTDSEESDPDWGCWSASQELKNPSIRIVFPTIERVKNASCGILASKHILCFSQKTWQRLRNINILHDAVPYPRDRVNHPMHAKIARRRFQSKKDASSFGWVYCGSHNFSAAAWGRPVSDSIGRKSVKTNPVLGSRLHICNYELGIIFIIPPSNTTGSPNQKYTSLDDIVLPFVVPAPKYRAGDRPATVQAMREALAEIREQERKGFMESITPEELMEGEISDEDDEILEATDYFTKEQEDEKAYAEELWSQVDSSETC
ncbi:uncharacterized protein LOC127794478 isoform X2 [Diospyros lotus]|uniref:uncharacterized protein LOC127794478 isoform X2 n=1 Tax=Diospyros lotus TaxID=55363 RepID=UPI002257A124|nr:uncharacterized protein LOC127794478 isoform X2 [Diospyros lotus]